MLIKGQVINRVNNNINRYQTSAALIYWDVEQRALPFTRKPFEKGLTLNYKKARASCAAKAESCARNKAGH